MKRRFKILSIALAISLIVAFMCGCSMFSSITAEDAVANLSDLGYKVTVYDKVENIECFNKESAIIYIEAINEENNFDRLSAILYKEKSIAQDLGTKVKEQLEFYYEKALKEGNEEDAKLYGGFIVKRVGRWMLIGSIRAVASFEGKHAY